MIGLLLVGLGALVTFMALALHSVTRLVHELTADNVRLLEMVGELREDRQR